MRLSVAHVRPLLFALATALACLPGRPARAASCTVPTSPGCATLQTAIDQASAGDTITVRERDGSNTPYFEKLTITTSGISLVAEISHTPIIDGTGVAGAHMISIDGSASPVNDVLVRGFEIRNHLNVSDGSGVRIVGAGDNIQIIANEIHHITGDDAMGITVYATKATPISNLVIDGNTIRDCEPARSEALVLNGNVDGFQVSNNLVRDVNNIGIDCIGGETDIQPNPNLVCRNGVIRGNTVIRANSQYEGGYGAGIYVDGGRDVVIENNIVTGSDLGIEIGAENAGLLTENIVVRNNVLYANEKAGIVFGGYASNVGRASNNSFTGNTLYKNNTLGPSGHGRFFNGNGVAEIWVQFGSNNRIANNIVYAGSEDVFIGSYEPAENSPNSFDFNLYFSDTGGIADGEFGDHGTEHSGFAAWQSGSGQDANSLATNPQLTDPANADFHIAAASPAVDAGDPAYPSNPADVDLDGQPRLLGARVDIGADEGTCGNGDPNDPGEQCDDGNTTNCDGCDNNCTLSTTCGNGVLCAPEACDDGNTTSGDCCSAACQFENAQASCDDSNVCTASDVCDGFGACTGTRIGGPSCALDAARRTCQEAIAKAGKKYFEARLKVLQACRNNLNKGRAVFLANGTPLADPADCGLEARGQGKVAGAAAKARDIVAKSGRPKCTDAIVAQLGACAATVDDLVAADAAGGCILAAADNATDAMVTDEFGVLLTGAEVGFRDLEKCQKTIATAGRGHARSRLKSLQSCRKSLDRGKALSFANDAPLSDPGDCPAEARTITKLAATGIKTRNKIANACSDALLGTLAATCATTVDALVAPGGTAGCLVIGHDADVDSVLDALH